MARLGGKTQSASIEIGFVRRAYFGYSFKTFYADMPIFNPKLLASEGVFEACDYPDDGLTLCNFFEKLLENQGERNWLSLEFEVDIEAKVDSWGNFDFLFRFNDIDLQISKDGDYGGGDSIVFNVGHITKEELKDFTQELRKEGNEYLRERGESS